jgi:hypothetical protein
MLHGNNLTPWPWKSIGFQTLMRTMYVPSLVKIHWRMLILECSQGCYAVKIWPCDIDLWPWKSIGFQILLRTKYVPCLVKIHWRILILECSQGCYAVKIWPGDLILECSQGCYAVKIWPCDTDLWPWKSIGFQTLLRTKYVPSLVKIHWKMLILVFTRMFHGKKFTQWPWPLTLKINRVPDSPKD